MRSGGRSSAGRWVLSTTTVVAIVVVVALAALVARSGEDAAAPLGSSPTSSAAPGGVGSDGIGAAPSPTTATTAGAGVEEGGAPVVGPPTTVPTPAPPLPHDVVAAFDGSVGAGALPTMTSPALPGPPSPALPVAGPSGGPAVSSSTTTLPSTSTTTASTSTVVPGAGSSASGPAFPTTTPPSVPSSGGRRVAVVPSLSVSGAPWVVDGSTLVFPVSLSEVAAGPVSASWATGGGSAVVGVDYPAQSGLVSLAAGETSTTISVSTTVRSVWHADRDVVVSLSAPSGADLGVSSGSGVIASDDPVVVTTTVDAVDAVPGDGACATALGACSLRAAVQELDAQASVRGAVAIRLADGASYGLTVPGAGEDLAATGDLDLVAPTPSRAWTISPPTVPATIDGGGLDRVFDVHATSLTLARVVVTGGRTGDSVDGPADGGGGVLARGAGSAVVLDGSVTVTANTARFGGGVYAEGSLSLGSVTVSANTATQSGGGVLSTGSLVIGPGAGGSTKVTGNHAGSCGGGWVSTGTAVSSGSAVWANTAGSCAGGVLSAAGATLTSTDDDVHDNTAAVWAGGMLVQGTATVTGSSVHANQAVYGGGFIQSQGTAALSGVTIDGNHAVTAEGSGGGVILGNLTGPASATVDATSTISGNAAVQGAGVLVSEGSVTLRAKVDHNTATGFGGGVLTSSITTTTVLDGARVEANAAAFGGAIYQAAGSPTMTLTDTTIDANTASGLGSGIAAAADVDVVRSTVSRGAGGIGAVVSAGHLQLTNATVSTNATVGVVNLTSPTTGTATVTSSTIAANTGGGIINQATAAEVHLAGSVLAAASGSVCAGPVTSDGHNLVGDVSCAVAAVGDDQGIDPLLESLGSNAGPTQTQPPGVGSLALNTGPTVGCPAVDQRGVVRAQGPGCDRGAVEITVGRDCVSPLVPTTVGVFEGKDLRNCDLRGEVLDAKTFHHSDLSGANASGMTVNVAVFDTNTMRGFDGSAGANPASGWATTSFTGNDLTGARFTSADLTTATFVGSDLDAATFDRARTGATLPEVVWAASNQFTPATVCAYGGPPYLQGFYGCHVAPIALVADAGSTTVAQALVVAAPGVLGNDTGPGLTVTGHTNPAHGTVTIAADGAYTYTPDPTYRGQDSFTYTVTDSLARTATTTVTIDIALAGPPVAGGYRNYLGTGNQAMQGASGPRDNYWLGVSGGCSSKENGDRIATQTDANYSNAFNPSFNSSWSSCTGGSTIANPEYDPNGYFYAIDVPQNVVGTFYVEVFDAGYCSSGPIGEFGGSFTTTFRLRQNDSPDPLQTTSLTQLSGASGVGCGAWLVLGSIANPTRGIYFVQVQSPTGTGTQIHGSNGFALRVRSGTTWSACTGDPAEASASLPYDAACPQIHAYSHMSVYNNLYGAAVTYPAARVAPELGGGQLVLELWDPGEGSTAVQVLDPNDNPVDFTWDVRCYDGTTAPCSDGTVAPTGGWSGASGSVTIGGGPSAGTSVPSALDLWGATILNYGICGSVTVPCAYNLQPGPYRASVSKYSDRLVVLHVPIPTDVQGSFGDKRWYKIKYLVGNSPTDRMTITTKVALQAVDDTATVGAGQTLTVGGKGLLANDIAVLPLVTGHTGPAHGTLALAPDGTYTYRPDLGFVGTDAFIYTLTDGYGRTTTATATITVTPP